MSRDYNPLLLTGFPQAILHVDADAFFASVAQALQPAYKGKPVVTGAERGVVIALSYEAKAFGIRRGHLMHEAKKLCPQLICLPDDFAAYGIFSKRMFSIIKRYSPIVEEYSIDEAFADLKGLRRLHHASYEEIGAKIQNAICQELGITVSVGISLSKSLAKLASKAKKPAGLVCVPGRSLHEFLNPIPLKQVWGFGSNTVALLNKNGFTTVLDFIRRPREVAVRLLGKIGDEIWRELSGESVYPINPSPKDTYASMSKFKTFAPPSQDADFVLAMLLRNLERCASKLRQFKLATKKIILVLRQNNFRDDSLELTFDHPASALLEFSGPARAAFSRLFKPQCTYRATGVVFCNLVADGAFQMTLFEDGARLDKTRRLSQAIDTLNQVYGRHQVHLADSLSAKKNTEEKSSACFKGKKRLGLPLFKI